MHFKKANQSHTIAYNFVMNAILTMSSLLFPFISYPYVSRILMPTGIGKVTFATSVIAYFSMFAQLGVPTYGVRAGAIVRDDKQKLTDLVYELLIINLFMSCLAYLGVAFAINLIPKLQKDKVLYVLLSSTIILTSIGVEWLYKSLEQYTYITVRSVIFKCIALIGMLLLVHNSDDYVIYAGLTIFAASASNILNFINLRKYIAPLSKRHLDCFQHIKPILVFFAMTCATTVYVNLDTVMLGLMAGDTDVGYYGTAVKVKTILSTVVSSLGVVMLPRASYYIATGKVKEFYSAAKKALGFVLTLSLPLATFFMIYAEESIYVLAGEKFQNAVVPMQIILGTIVFIGFTNVTGIQMLVPLKREKFVLISVACGAIVDFIANLVLIPYLKSSGAAIGTLLAEIVVWGIQYYVLKKIVITEIKMKDLKIHRTVFACFCAAIISVLGKYFFFNIFLRLIVAAIVFFSMYVGVLILMKDQIIIMMLNKGKSLVKSRASHK